MTRSIRKSSLLAGVASVAAASLLAPAMSSAAVTYTLTDLGTAVDAFQGTATGYEAYSITLTASSGNVISAITAGSVANDGLGFTGTLLQDFTPPTRGTAAPSPTPQQASLNNTQAGLGADSHFYQAGSLVVTAPFEDSDNVHPTGAPVNGSLDAYGTGTYLKETIGVTPVASLTFAYLVVPKVNPNVTMNVQIADGLPGLAPTDLQIINVPLFTSSPPPTTTAVTLSTTAVTTQATLTVTKTTSGYLPSATYTGYANQSTGNFTGVQSGAVQANGFAAGDTEVYGLAVLLNGGTASSSALTDLAGFLNNNNSTGGVIVYRGETTGLPTGITASQVAAAFAGLKAPSENVAFISTGSPGASPEFFSFNVAGFTTDGTFTVTAITAVPEPISIAGLAIGGASLLLGRRKRVA